MFACASVSMLKEAGESKGEGFLKGRLRAWEPLHPEFVMCKALGFGQRSGSFEVPDRGVGP